MFFCLLVKTISQIITYFVDKKNHHSHNDKLKSICFDWHGDIFYICHLGYFFTKNPIKNLFVKINECFKIVYCNVLLPKFWVLL